MAKGCYQREYIEYRDTFSAIAKIVVVRALLITVAQFNLPLFHLDVNNAFLNLGLFEEISLDLGGGDGL